MSSTPPPPPNSSFRNGLFEQAARASAARGQYAVQAGMELKQKALLSVCYQARLSPLSVPMAAHLSRRHVGTFTATSCG